MARKLNRRLNLRLEKESRFVSRTETEQQAALAPLSSDVSGAHIFVCLYQATLHSVVVWRIVKRVVYH